MRPLVALVPVLLMGAGAAAVLPTLSGDAGEAHHHHAAAPADAHGQADVADGMLMHGEDGMHDGTHVHDQPYARDDVHAWSSPDGHLPAADAALKEYDHIIAAQDRGLAELSAKGVFAGSGTREDPYVLDGVRVDRDLSISDTDSYLVLRNSIVGGQLTLNWDGQHVHAHHLRVADLRINENVKRTGDNTGGLLENNAIAFIGQMRHFAGVFQANQVGPRPQNAIASFLGDEGVANVEDGEVWNFDGFDLAEVHDNDVEGLVDIKLHGHYHGDCFLCLGHSHAGQEPQHDHTTRWTSLEFRDNRIHVLQGTALLYRDTPHAGDDRTAASETSPALDMPHVHHTLIRLERNTMDGPLEVKVFNSKDERHLNGSEGWLDILGNRITLPSQPGLLPMDQPTIGMDLHDARGVHLAVRDNVIGW
ncbi:MAG: hypothetical protein LC624_02320, partial [Halobacteriales archaeon]|nr:hypothetical protein [Halobacteriales archaeon]